MDNAGKRTTRPRAERRERLERFTRPEEALSEIEACTGTQFDPRLARLFVAEYRQHGHSLKRYRVAPDAG